MTEKIDRLQVYYTVEVGQEGSAAGIEVDYRPVTAAGAEVPELRGVLQIPIDREPELANRCQALLQAVGTIVAEKEIEVDGTLARVRPQLDTLQVFPNKMVVTFWEGSWQGGLPAPAGHASVPLSRLSAGQVRLLGSISATVERMAWEDLRRRVGAPPPPTARARVFISYRSGHEKFAEALARRLGQEGIIPWFDKWDVRAGDSVPGKIEEGLGDSVAFIPIITGDYHQGRWATDELHAAIVKRLEQDYKIIPVLLEDCERPDLIAHLRYVDMSKQDPETFEAKFGELVDGIYGLELNPFR